MKIETFEQRRNRVAKREKTVYKFCKKLGQLLFGKNNVSRGMGRFVGLRKTDVIKIPRLDNFDLFLLGWLYNRNELAYWRLVSRMGDERTLLLSPIERSFFWGLVIIMKRARVLSEQEFEENYEKIKASGVDYFSTEIRRDMFGYLDNRIVCFDYAGEPTSV
jgi:hypothetical protein